ncbi:MAG: TIGR03769 domain-containing protein [Verrucomicrobia bacterium]|nr:TIGR03769 domain-containing protein [Verrucomicrobiota bacterium]
MKSSVKFVLTGIAATAAVINLNAQIPLDTGDTDIGIAYEDGWDLHVHKEEPPNDGEYEPADALLQVNAQALTTVPSEFSRERWQPRLDSAKQPGGKSAVPGLCHGGNRRRDLRGRRADPLADRRVRAGRLFGVLPHLWQPDGVDELGRRITFGNPTVWMNSGDGFSGVDSLVLPTGTHQHFNLAFTAPGDYTVTFEAAGTLVAGSQFTQSGPVDYFFTVVVPEPSTAALTGVGIATWFAVVRRKRNARG